MFSKATLFLLLIVCCATSFGQDAVFNVKRKLQENIAAKTNGQQEFLKAVVAGKEEIKDFNPYDPNLLAAAKDLNFDGKCLSDLITVGLDLVTLQGYAVQMLDSAGKFSAGLLYSNNRWLGFYQECKRAEKIVDGEVKIRGKYCRAWSGIGVKGICVPDSCNAAEIIKLNEILANLTSGGSGVLPGLSLPDVYECVEDIPWITGDYVTLAICGVIGLFLLLGTAYDVVLRIRSNQKDASSKKTEKSDIALKSYVQNGEVNGTVTPDSSAYQNGGTNGTVSNGYENGGFRTVDEESQKTQNGHTHQNTVEKTKPEVSKKRSLGVEALLCFSILTNGEKLFSFKSSGSNELTAINGIRSLSFGWVVLGHTYTFIFLNIDNLGEVDFFVKKASAQLILTGVYAVDTFFFLSGLLVAYSTIKLLKKTKGKMNWPMFYIHRYIRLTIIYGFSILFMATLWRHVVKGIFQNKVASGRQAEVDPIACQKYWWTNILYINNFYPHYNEGQSCHGVGWYMANDMQLFIISPIYVYLLYRKRVIGHIIVLVGIVTSFMANGIMSSKYDLTSLMFGSEPKSPDQSYYEWMLYSRPYYRMGAYLVGISAGELLLHKPKFNKIFVAVGWLVALGLHYTLIFGMYPRYRDGGISMSTEIDALFNATHRTVWAVTLAWVVYACAHGLGGPINWFLSWNIWGPISRLSFAGYLTHAWVLATYMSGLQTLIHLNDFSAAMLFVAAITTVLPVSAILSLAVEAPVMRLQKLLLASK